MDEADSPPPPHELFWGLNRTMGLCPLTPNKHVLQGRVLGQISLEAELSAQEWGKETVGGWGGGHRRRESQPDPQWVPGQSPHRISIALRQRGLVYCTLISQTPGLARAGEREASIWLRALLKRRGQLRLGAANIPAAGRQMRQLGNGVRAGHQQLPLQTVSRKH